jgi:hypothetical protein
VGGAGDVGAAGWGVPDEHARLGLGQPPSLGLFDPVMVPAEWPQVAFAGPATLAERGGVVVVADAGGHTAAGRGAAGVADLDEMPK